MFNRQFSLVVTAILLLSPSLVQASETNEDMNISVGNIRIQTSGGGTSIQTPNININTPPSTAVGNIRIQTSGGETSIQTPNIYVNTAKSPIERTLISRNRRRYRTSIKRGRIYRPAIRRAPIDPDQQISINRSTMRNGTTQRSIVRSSSSSSSNGSQSISEQSVQCQGSGSSSVSQSSQTINGRTVSSTVTRNCQ